MKKTHLILSALLVTGTAAKFTSTVSAASSETAGQYIDDSAITTKVKTALVKDGGVPKTAVKVKTHQGTVQLSGFVDNSDQKQRAEEIASQVKGVVSVENKIEVKTHLPASTSPSTTSPSGSDDMSK